MATQGCSPGACLTRKAEGAEGKNQAHIGSKAGLQEHKGEPAGRQCDHPWRSVGGGDGSKGGLESQAGGGLRCSLGSAKAGDQGHRIHGDYGEKAPPKGTNIQN